MTEFGAAQGMFTALIGIPATLQDVRKVYAKVDYDTPATGGAAKIRSMD